MSFPANMKTGIGLGSTAGNNFPEIFFIIYLILASILRRCGFKDAILYSSHNSIPFDHYMFDSGVLFNLFSEYGVGKSLEPLINELFRNFNLDPDINMDNIYFNEIVRLTNEVSKIIRSHNPSLETEWMFRYATEMEFVYDNIAVDRLNRIKPLLISPGPDQIGPDQIEDSDNEMDQSDDNNSDNEMDQTDESDNDDCLCLFCEEFRLYHYNKNDNIYNKKDYYPERNVSAILNEVLMNIAKNISNSNK